MTNTEKAAKFFVAHCGGEIGSLSAIHPTEENRNGKGKSTAKIRTKSFSTHFLNGDTEEIQQWISNKIDSWNLYYSVNPLKDHKDKKVLKTDIKAMSHVHVDADVLPGETIEKARARILERVTISPLKPSTIICSGNGFNLLWKLAKPSLVTPEIIEELESFNRRTAAFFGGDDVHNLDRILRLPFTTNFPNAKKLKLGRKEVPTELIYHKGVNYED